MKDWTEVFDTWSRELSFRGFDVRRLWDTVRIDVLKSETAPEVSFYDCWPRSKISEYQLNLQDIVDYLSQDDWIPEQVLQENPFHPKEQRLNKGQQDTLNYLWRVRDRHEEVCAILIAASLFSDHEILRNQVKGETFYDLRELTHSYLEEKGWQPGSEGLWHHFNTEVLCRQISSVEYDYSNISGIRDLIRFLARRHAEMFLQYQPVHVISSDYRDPQVSEILKGRREKRAEESEKAQRRREALNAARLAEEAEIAKSNIEKIKKHPRFGQWGSISRKELTALVWSKPAREIAKEFGVSDVAVGKKCKSLNISKPPRGFWNRVSSGRIPHPGGKLPNED